MTIAPIVSPKVGQRIAQILFITQSLGSAALISNATVNPIVGSTLSGNDTLAGVPGTMLLLGAALASYPAGLLMQRIGRRPGLSLGFFLGAIGMSIGGYAIVTSSFALFLLGLFLIGGARGAVDQSRYAAADANLPENRARAISTVVFAGTVGAVGGPLLVEPLGVLVHNLFGYEVLAGPMIGGAVLFTVSGILISLLLRPDPRDVSRIIAEALKKTDDTPTPAARELRVIARLHGVQLAALAMLIGQAIMVLVMTVTSLHMKHYQHTLGDISLVIMAHTLGMYGLSFLTGTIADRFGRNTVIATGAIVLIAGCVIAPISTDVLPLAIGLFLVGVGWNMCYIGGSSLLADNLAPAERGRYQGAVELTVNIASAVGSLSSGFLLASQGFTILCVIASVLTCAPLLMIMFQRVSKRNAAVFS
jgi:MFS family permease